MSRIFRALSVVAVLAILGAAAYGAFVAVGAAVRVFAATDKTVASALVTASATAIVAVVTLVLGKLYELRIHVQKENRDKKIPVYEDLLKFFFRMLNANKEDGSTPVLEDPEVVEFFTRFNERFIIWASDDVMRSWGTWRRQLPENTASPSPEHALRALFLIEDVMLAIRKDLGHGNKGLNRGDVLGLFINDIDSVLAKQSPDIGSVGTS